MMFFVKGPHFQMRAFYYKFSEYGTHKKFQYYRAY